MVEPTAYSAGNSPNKESAETNNNNNSSSSNAKSLLNSDPISASDSTTTVIKPSLSLRSQIMEEFGINNDTISEKDNIDTDSLNTLVQIRLIKERKLIETMRKDNITILNEIVDKCISSDKLNESNISKLLDTILDKKTTRTTINKQESLMSPMAKKRRVAQSPRVSTTRQFDHRTGNSDLHSINEKDSTNQSDAEQFQSVAQSYKLPVPPSANATSAQSQSTASGQPWQTQYPNPALQPPYMYQSNPNMPPGSLAPGAHMMNDPYYHQQAMMQQQGYETQMGKQYLEPPQFLQNYPPGYYPPHGRVMQGINEHGYSNIPQQHSPYRNNIATVGSGPPGRKGHRRTQSAIVSMPNELKSPSRAAPQRPVNFLIHTPKHPPPT